MTRIADIAPRKSHSRKTKKRLAAKAARLADLAQKHPQRFKKRR